MKEPRWSYDEISALCLELGLFLHAGLDAGSGLSLLAEEEPEPARKRTLREMARRMDEGASLSGALRDAGCFPEYLTGLTEVGERTGHTEEALNALSRYYQRRVELDRYLRTALLYPMVLLLVLLVVLVVLLAKVLPVFDSVYASLGGQLTGLSGGLLLLGRFLDAGMPLLCVLLILSAALLVAFAGADSFRDRLLSLWRRRCGDRGVAGLLSRARFAQSLAMGLESGLSGQESLSLAASLLADQPVLEQRCREGCEQLAQGGSLAQVIRESELLPPGDCRLLELGLRSGCQDTVAAQLAQRLTEESEAALEARIGQVEPALVLAASVLVGVVLLSVMLPLMNIMSVIG